MLSNKQGKSCSKLRPEPWVLRVCQSLVGWKEESEVGSYKTITLVVAIDKGLFLEAINCQQMSSLVISPAKRKKKNPIWPLCTAYLQTMDIIKL